MDKFNEVLDEINETYYEYNEKQGKLKSRLMELFDLNKDVSINIEDNRMIKFVGDFYMTDTMCKTLQKIQNIRYSFTRWDDCSELRIDITHKR